METPAQISAAITAFTTQPIAEPESALVTGYDFLTDQANAIDDTLESFNIQNRQTLINNTWNDDAFRASFFAPGPARDLNSLNSHFAHDRLFPNNPNDTVFASEVPNTTNYSGSLIFSVGCHSGLNVPTGADWAEALSGRGAAFIGNLGHGYGDDELIAYSERLMVNFVEELGAVGSELPTTGRALLLAKQRYLNSLAPGTLGNYDEKILAEMTLYGLPMQQVRTPNQPATPPPSSQTEFNPTFTYTTNNVASGNYSTIKGQNEILVAGGRPVQPKTTIELNTGNNIAHGVLMLGGTWSDSAANFNPVIGKLVNENVDYPDEPSYPFAQWFPSQIASVNRFVSFDGNLQQRLVIVPGQYRAANATSGTQRLYSSLNLKVLTTPEANVDFTAPQINEFNADWTPTGLRFRVRVGDESGQVGQVVVLYAAGNSRTWTGLNLTYDPATGFAEATAVGVPRGIVRYFVQAADVAGNVTLDLDHGNPYEVGTPFPGSAVLDTFNRVPPNTGSLGNNWEGQTAPPYYTITGNALDVQQGGPIVWSKGLGTNQEAFVTFSALGASSRSQGLLLKAQTSNPQSSGAIRVTYDAVSSLRVVNVATVKPNGGNVWQMYPGIPATFAAGDQFGARALANGTVQVYKNGTLIGTVVLDSADQSYFKSRGGKIGIWTDSAPDTELDNFGGGNVAP